MAVETERELVVDACARHLRGRPLGPRAGPDPDERVPLWVVCEGDTVQVASVAAAMRPRARTVWFMANLRFR